MSRLQVPPLPPVTAGRHRISLSDIGAALPDIGMAVVSLTVWILPTLPGERTVAWLVLVAMFEFIVIHSTIVLGTVMFGPASKAQKIRWTIGLSLFYSLFAGAFSAMFKTWWPFWSFWGLTINRLLTVLLPHKEGKADTEILKTTWIAAIVFYVAAALLTGLLPFPRLGITESVVDAQNLPGTGLWIEKPHRAVALCFLYFTSMACFELFGFHRRIQLSMSRSRDSTSSNTKG